MPKIRWQAFDSVAALEISIRVTFSGGTIKWLSRASLQYINLHDKQTVSCFLTSVVVVRPLCADELLADSIARRNIIEDMVFRHFLHFGSAPLPTPSRGKS